MPEDIPDGLKWALRVSQPGEVARSSHTGRVFSMIDLVRNDILLKYSQTGIGKYALEAEVARIMAKMRPRSQ